jgi:four helix bundle protein
LHPFTKLTIWTRSQELAVDVYRLTKAFPAEEKFSLTSQLRRAVLSVSTNVAEGSKRRHATDFARFVNIAEGSLAETESLLRISGRLGYADSKAIGALLDEVEALSRMTCAFRIKVERQPPASAA